MCVVCFAGIAGSGGVAAHGGAQRSSHAVQRQPREGQEPADTVRDMTECLCMYLTGWCCRDVYRVMRQVAVIQTDIQFKLKKGS